MLSVVRLCKAAGVVVLLALMAACASGPGANPRDPLEPFNRGVTQFNDGLDRAIVKPAAIAYDKITPSLVRTGVSNFFRNLADAWTAVNGVLQLKPQVAVDSFFRFQINTLFGLGGLLDVASEANIERHREDFGQTLGHWGVPPGPYLVLPVLGPSTLRDTVALPVDGYGNGVSHFESIPARNSMYALRGVEARANLLRAGNVLDQAALDKYSFTRDVYLQLRQSEVYDGNLPDQEAEPPPDEDKPGTPSK